MPNVIVTKADKGKFKVLVNYVQQGIDYTSEAQANHEANKVRKELERIYKR